MGCKTGGSGIKSVPGGIVLEPKVPTVVEETPDPNACPSSSTEESSTCCNSTTGGLPYCPPEVEGCSPCLPPDAVMITATPRDPYYIDELAIALGSGDQTQAVRVNVDGNIPLVRPVAFRHAALPGVAGVPSRVRSDIETHELEHQAINMYSTIPQSSAVERQVAVIDRFNNRWVIVKSISTEPSPIHRRISPSHFARGRGVAPWWKTGYPDGASSTGVG